MDGKEGTSNDGSTCDGIQYLKSESVDNSFGTRIGNDNGEWDPGPREALQTYKRRKRTRSNSESNDREDGRGSNEAASKLEDETIKEQLDCLPENPTFLDDSNDVRHKQCRNFILEHIYQSLNNDEGGIQGCIRDALRMTVKETDSHDKDRDKFSALSESMPNGSCCAVTEHVDVTSNESLDGTYRPVTEMCQHAFLNIIRSEKFTLLCKLLFENFQEMKTNNLSSLSLINIRMKDGIYEHSPWLFCADIQRVWKKLQGIGNELISITKNLSDVSLTCCNEQQICTRESYFHGKSEQIDPCGVYNFCTCQRCGGKVDGGDYLVCDSCEEMYRVSCMDPAVKEIPSRSWYCASCTAGRMGSPHENCIACERLNVPRTLCTHAGDEKGSQTTEKISSEFEEASNWTRDDFHEPSGGSKVVCFCKLCGSEVENGGKIMICEHVGCPYKYYHKRCLTTSLLKSYGPRWYCPSCLCRVCLIDKDDDKIVLCDGCDHGCHMYCMSPPRTSVPRGKWFCRQCDMKIKEIRRARRQYEKQENRMKKKVEGGKRACEILEKELNGKCEQVLDRGREGMDMLLTAAFTFE